MSIKKKLFLKINRNVFLSCICNIVKQSLIQFNVKQKCVNHYFPNRVMKVTVYSIVLDVKYKLKVFFFLKTKSLILY